MSDFPIFTFQTARLVHSSMNNIRDSRKLIDSGVNMMEVQKSTSNTVAANTKKPSTSITVQVAIVQKPIVNHKDTS